MKNFTISVIIPAFNEQDNLPVLFEKLLPILAKYPNYEIIVIDDGSTDDTLALLEKLAKENSSLKYLSLSRNFGHQIALKAGLDHAKGDCVISIDADLQHPPALIDAMIEKWREGYEVVYTIRRDENTSFFKRHTSAFFYKLLNLVSDIEIEKGLSDFRLIDASVLEALKSLTETHFFLRGLVPWLGFKQHSISYTPGERYSGESKYSLKKMILFALDGFTSFSVNALHVITFLGIFVSLLAFAYILYTLYMAVFTDTVIPGWASILVSVLFLGGLQLIILGILGEYLGKVFIQAKNRPLYIVRRKDLKP